MDQEDSALASDRKRRLAEGARIPDGFRLSVAQLAKELPSILHEEDSRGQDCPLVFFFLGV